MRCWVELTDVLVEEIIEKVNDTNAASSFPEEQDHVYQTRKDCALFLLMMQLLHESCEFCF